MLVVITTKCKLTYHSQLPIKLLIQSLVQQLEDTDLVYFFCKDSIRENRTCSREEYHRIEKMHIVFLLPIRKKEN